jgi:hypothetical protein
MKIVLILALTISVLGCGGYGSGSGSGSMAAGAPNISALMPNSAKTTDPAFTLTVNGSGFVGGSVIYWNGSPRTTAFVMGGQVTTPISTADIAAPATIPVYVLNPGGTGTYSNQPGQRSNTMTFTVQ